jgi:hypothetical protein
VRHLLGALLVMLVACGGGDPAPSAVIEAYTPESLDPADDRADDLTLTVAYEDGDGDLGGGVATVTDCRTAELATVLELPPIASEEGVEANVPISGTLDLVVADVDVVTIDVAPAVCAELGAPALSAGQAAFCVVLTDAGGVSGAGDCTGAIAIAEP